MIAANLWRMASSANFYLVAPVALKIGGQHEQCTCASLTGRTKGNRVNVGHHCLRLLVALRRCGSGALFATPAATIASSVIARPREKECRSPKSAAAFEAA